MSLTNSCLGASLIYLSLGLLTGLIMQIELAAPGLLVAGDMWKQTYQYARRLHAVLLQFAWPLAGIAGLGAAVFRRARGQEWAGLFGWSMLILSGLSLVAVFVIMALGPIPALMAERLMQDLSFISLGLSGVGVILAMYAARTARASRFIFALLGLLALGLMLALLRLITAANVALVSETYVQLALQHTVALCLTFWALSVACVWAAGNGREPGVWSSLIFGLAIMAAGTALVRMTMRLGLMGMPQGYPDYPDAYAGVHASVSGLMMVILMLVLIGMARLWWLSRQVSAFPAGEFD